MKHVVIARYTFNYARISIPFLLFDEEAFQHYVDPHMNLHQGKKEPVLHKDQSMQKTFGITALKQACSGFPPPVDSSEKDVIKELK